jgi:flagellar hook-basal body complex protein FliE
METPAIKELLPFSMSQGIENKGSLSETDSKENFAQWLRNSLGQVNAMQQHADESAQKLIKGESEDIHGTMIEMEKASVAFNLVMQVRNKIVSAYEEIQRMQL